MEQAAVKNKLLVVNLILIIGFSLFIAYLLSSQSEVEEKAKRYLEITQQWNQVLELSQPKGYDLMLFDQRGGLQSYGVNAYIQWSFKTTQLNTDTKTLQKELTVYYNKKLKNIFPSLTEGGYIGQINAIFGPPGMIVTDTQVLRWNELSQDTQLAIIDKLTEQEKAQIENIFFIYMSVQICLRP